MPVWSVSFAAAVLLLSVGGSWAGVYKFVDSKGISHYTDDLLQVPEDQRPALEEESVEPANSPKDGAEGAGGPATQKATEDKPLAFGDAGDTTHGDSSADKLRLDKLQAMRRQLDGEYDAIMLEQKRLSQMRDRMKTPQERQMFAESAGKLDVRIKAYEKKRSALAAQIRQYNEKMRHLEEKRRAIEAEMASFSGNANGG